VESAQEAFFTHSADQNDRALGMAFFLRLCGLIAVAIALVWFTYYCQNLTGGT
jgi:hypothetical protein